MDYVDMFERLFIGLVNSAEREVRDFTKDYARDVIQEMCDQVSEREYYLINWVMDENNIDSDGYGDLEKEFLKWAKMRGYKVCE